MKNPIYPIFRRMCFSLVIALLFLPELAAETPSEASETLPEAESLPIPAEPDPLPQQAATSDEWQISFAPYLWMVNLTGTQTIGQITVPIEIDFSDLVDRLKFAFATHFEASKGQWGGIVDFNYAAIGDNQVVDIPILGTADYNFDIFYLDLLAFYRLPYDRHSFDVIFGTRYRNLKMDLRFTSGLNPGFDVGWWDPLVGIRYIGKLHPEKLDVILNGKVGGFDIGSQFTGEFSVGVKINLTPKISMPVLYRYLHIQYQEGSGADFFNYHANEQGLLIGLGFNF
jgi:opacity protein-like surface antigen